MKNPSQTHLEDFAGRVQALIAPYGSIAKAAKSLGIPENTLRRACAGANEPQAPLLIALSTKLGVSIGYLLGLTDDPTPGATTLGEAPAPPVEFTRVPNLDARVSAGLGHINHIVSIEQMLAFPIWMLRRLAPPGAKLSFLRAHGDSMLPLFGDGALLLVNESENEVPRVAPRPKGEFDTPDLYVFLQDDALRVKRLRWLGKAELLVTSENRAYAPDVLRGPDLKRCKIIGRVIWWDTRL